MTDINKKAQYKTPVPPDKGFLRMPDKDYPVSYAESDLKNSGLTLDDMSARPCMTRSAHYDVQYFIPYFDMEGKPIVDDEGMISMYRLRGELTSKGVSDKRGKYMSPSRDQVGELSTMPYLHWALWDEARWPDGYETVAITEGEKKAASMMKYMDIPTIGIGGKDNWHPRKDQSTLHPMIKATLDKLGAKNILIVPDGDVRKYHIEQSYGSLARLLTSMGYNVRMPLLPEMRDKIDDLIVGDWAGSTPADLSEAISDLPEITQFTESLGRLRDEYGLQTTGTGDRVRVPPNSTNITRLISHHPAFEDLYYNEDNQHMFLADTQLDENGIHGILCQIQRSFSMPQASKRVVADAVRDVAHTHRGRSPRAEWLHSLEWDKQERLGTWMLDYCNAKDTPMAREAGLKWLVAAVARTMEAGCKVDYMLITTGAQGIGKSSIPTILFGRDAVQDITSLGSDGNDKDSKTIMHRSWCANWEELNGLSRSDRNLETLKTQISATHDSFRRAYSADDVTLARRFVMYGSTNLKQFLKADDSGYRRFAIVECGQVEFARLEDDREQLWAEAVELYNSGTVDVSEVQAAKNQGGEYAHGNNEYESMHEVACDVYDGMADKTKGAAGSNSMFLVKKMDSIEYLCSSMKTWKQVADIPFTRGRSGETLNEILRAHGWILKSTMRLREGKVQRAVWCCPTALLEPVED